MFGLFVDRSSMQVPCLRRWRRRRCAARNIQFVEWRASSDYRRGGEQAHFAVGKLGLNRSSVSLPRGRLSTVRLRPSIRNSSKRVLSSRGAGRRSCSVLDEQWNRRQTVHKCVSDDRRLGDVLVALNEHGGVRNHSRSPRRTTAARPRYATDEVRGSRIHLTRSKSEFLPHPANLIAVSTSERRL